MPVADKNLNMADHSMSERAIIVSSECMDRIACETYLSLFIRELPYFGANKCSNCEVPPLLREVNVMQNLRRVSGLCVFPIRVLRVMIFRAE